MKINMVQFEESEDGANVLLVRGKERDYIQVWDGQERVKVQIPQGLPDTVVLHLLELVDAGDIFCASMLYELLNGER